MSWGEFFALVGLFLFAWFIWDLLSPEGKKRRASLPSRHAAAATIQDPEKINRPRNSSRVLLHFTPVDNLAAISNRGLLTLESLGLLAKFNNVIVNDHYRHDKRIFSSGAICLSIGHPNPAVFESYRHKYPNRKFVVLELSAHLLSDKNGFIVCPTNAAATEVSGLWKRTPHLMKGDEALSELFASRIRRQEKFEGSIEDYFRPASLSRALTTDPQAEILYLKNINRTRIIGIHVVDSTARDQVQGLLGSLNWAVEVCVTPSYFSMRPDSFKWQSYRTDTEDFGKRVMERRGN